MYNILWKKEKEDMIVYCFIVLKLIGMVGLKKMCFKFDVDCIIIINFFQMH